MKNLTQKTSRKPKKTKNQKKNNIPGLLEKEKCKNQKNLEKTKKNKKNNIPGLLEKEKCKNQKNLEKTKKNNIPEVWRWGLQTRVLEYCFFWFFGCFWFSRGFLDFCIFTFARVLEYCFFCFFCFFLVFSRFFCFLDFCFCKSPGILFFFGFFGFLEVFLVFWIFAFARVLEYCFSLGFLVFSRFF